MLPSTGYFKSINCPFYDNGSCERPYCHFRHSKREDVGGATGVVGMVETQAASDIQDTRKQLPTAPNPDVLEQLVTEAVKKVLADQEVTLDKSFPENIVSQVVEGLKPTLARVETPNMIGKHVNIPTPITKPVTCVYNPTPIAELKKRHIPVAIHAYMPVAKSKVSIKRKSSPDETKPWLGIPQDSNSSQIKEVTYKPTAINNSNDNSLSVQNYIPTSLSDSSPSNSYEDSNSNDYMFKVKEPYYPRSKKRREEYVPKKMKTPLQTVQRLPMDSKYQEEFDLMDEILTSGHSLTKSELDEDTQDYMDIEAKFSDEEEVPNIVSSPIKDKSKQSKSTINFDPIDEKEKENKKEDKIEISSGKQNLEKTKTIKDEKSKSKDHHKSSTKKKVKSDKHHSEKKKEERKSSSGSSSNKSTHKEKKDNRGNDSRKDTKDKHEKHKSNQNDKHHSVSKDHKSKHKRSSKSSHKSDTNSDETRQEKKSKSTKNDQVKTKTKSSKTKSDSDKTSKKYSSKSIEKSSNHSTKTEKIKQIKNGFDHDDKSNSSFEPLPSPIRYETEFSDSEHDVEEECLKIFQEYQVSDQPSVVSLKDCSKTEIEDSEEVGRKRIAHPSANSVVSRLIGPSQPPKKISNPQQRMYERWRLMKEASLAAQSQSITSSSAASNNNDAQVNANARIRIAHVPYAISLTMAKKKVTESIEKAKDTSNVKTAAQTTKGGSRVAHVPQVVPNLIRPEPLQHTAQKFSLNIRQYYINVMHDICVQIYTNSEDAASRAQQEELSCHDRCKALAVYKNSCMLAAHRLRKEVDQNRSNTGSGIPSSGMVSHEAVLAGKSKGTWSVLRTKKSVMNFKGNTLYTWLTKWIMTEQELRDNGFPRSHPDGPKGRAKVYVTTSRHQNLLSKVPNERICSRCGQNYMVDRFGFSVVQQNCIYHWGRKFTIRGESKYSCCQQYGSADGCCDAKTHVWDYIDYENLRGYVKTFPKEDVPDEEQGVYALDCEMCYTTMGLELTRVTVINDDCKVVYETLVKPQNSIIDYNTRFSGIREEDMEHVTTTLLDVQATLLTMFSEKTILVGHSLESDLKALRLLHDTIVDTSVMFPHRYGLPQKRALKNLCSEYLRKIIQNDVAGHDSKEDAMACMELVLWKVKEEAKLQ